VKCLDAGEATTSAVTKSLPWCSRVLHESHRRHPPAPIRHGCDRRLHAHSPTVPSGYKCHTHHPNHHLSATLDHPEDRWLLRGECAASAFPFASSAPATPPFFFTSSGFPLCPATMETSSHATSSVHVGEGFLRTMPWRH